MKNFTSDQKEQREEQLLTVKKGGVISTKDEVIAKPTPPIVKKEEILTKPERDAAPIVKETNSAKYHTVGSSETLYSISKKYGVSVNQIQAWNGLTSNSISLGQKLKVSAGNATYTGSNNSASTESKKTIPSSNTTTHIVKPGETLYSISKKYGVNVADIKKWNNLESNSISVGNKIIVKK